MLKHLGHRHLHASHSIGQALVLLSQIGHLFFHHLNLADARQVDLLQDLRLGQPVPRGDFLLRHVTWFAGAAGWLLLLLPVLHDDFVVETFLHILHELLMFGFGTVFVRSDEPIRPLGVLEHLRKGLADLGLPKRDLLFDSISRDIKRIFMTSSFWSSFC